MPIPYAGSSEMIPVNPTGYYRTPGVPYPRPPTDPNRNRDLLGNVIDPAMEPDMGSRTADPATAMAMQKLTATAPSPAPSAAPTVLQPSRTSAFSRSDAQSLQGLDPRALEEARAMAAMPEAQSKPMTGTFGGKSFTMQPAARVDRNALAGVYQKYLTKQGQEREDAVRAQEQSGKERIVSIPGEQATQREKLRLESGERVAGADREFKAPERDANVAAKQAQTAAAVGQEARTQQQFGEEFTPETKAADRLYEQLTTGPFAQTAQARAAAKAIFPRTSYAAGVAPEEAAVASEAMGQPAPAGDAFAEIEGDPGIARLIERAKTSEPGFFTGPGGRATGAAARKVAEAAIAGRLRARGVPEDQIRDYITSALGPGTATTGTAVRPFSAAMRALPGMGAVAGAMESFAGAR